MGLRGILDHAQTMLARQVKNRAHLGWLPKPMNRDDGLRFRRQRLSERRRVHRISAFVHIYEDRCGTGKTNCLSGRDKSVGHRDDLVVPTDAAGEQSEPKIVSAIPDADRLLAVTEMSEVFIKRLDKRSTGQNDALYHLGNTPGQCRPERVVLSRQLTS